jgi:hypothetical protein
MALPYVNLTSPDVGATDQDYEIRDRNRLATITILEETCLQWVRDVVEAHSEGCESGKNDFLEEIGAPTIARNRIAVFEVRITEDIEHDPSSDYGIIEAIEQQYAETDGFVGVTAHFTRYEDADD